MSCTVVADDLSVCIDCALIIANGEITDGREDEGADACRCEYDSDEDFDAFIQKLKHRGPYGMAGI